jgi:hypothetical protein
METRISFRIFPALTALIIIALAGCSQSVQEISVTTSVIGQEVVSGMQIDANATFKELTDELPELILPFPKLETWEDDGHSFPWFPPEFDDQYYFRQHADMWIPSLLAVKFLDITPRMVPSYPQNSRFIATGVGKVSLDSFIVLIYHLAFSAAVGEGYSFEELDSLIKGNKDEFLSEFRLATFSYDGKQIASHPFGFNRSNPEEDTGCAELLADLTANVYDNPSCLGDELSRPCRVDHHITILPDGRMKVKTKKYK